METTNTTESKSCCAPTCCAPDDETHTAQAAVRTPEEIRESVRSIYGNIAVEGGSCCTPTGCASTNLGEHATKLGYGAESGEAPDEANLGLGCGNPHAMAALRSGEVVLDLGSGAGFDSFIASRHVGPTGSVIGVDMTPEMIEKARGIAAENNFANVEFRLGQIESLPVDDGTVDVILSNCVINLVPDKAQAFREAFRVLRPGGRVAISDVVALKPAPAEILESVAAYAGCIAGASTIDQVKRDLTAAGFEQVSVIVDQGSREVVDGWMAGAGQYVASARIEAIRPR